MGTHRATREGSAVPRVRAVLAGALVLGVGASVTTASWTDTEYATGSFGASVFSIESTVSAPYSAAGPWRTNETAPGATLTFDAAGMHPGKSVYAPIALRTQPSSVAGTVTLGGAAVTNSTTTPPLLGAALVYRVVRSETCGAGAFGSGAAFVVGSATSAQPLTTGQTAGAATLPAATATTPGSSVHFCFEVTLPPTNPTSASNGLQGKSASAVWLFSAVSAP